MLHTMLNVFERADKTAEIILRAERLNPHTLPLLLSMTKQFLSFFSQFVE